MSKTTIPAGGLADSAVTTAKINADAVTDAKIADDVVGSEHLTANEVDATAIANNAVGVTQLNLSDGSSGQFLKTDGSGTLSFATVDTSVDISGTTEESGTLATGDELLIFDASASANRSINIANFLKSHANHTSSSVGTIVLAQANTAVTHNNTLAGSNLTYSHSSTSLSSGTWKAMGNTGSGDRCCWRRIS